MILNVEDVNWIGANELLFDGIRDAFLPGYEPLFMLVECGSN